MPRAFDSKSTSDQLEPTVDGPSGASTAARGLAVALAALTVTFLVAARSSGAFGAEARNPGNRFVEGYVALTDDDKGQALFDIPALTPDVVEENCIAVRYEGTALPAIVRLGARSGGSLAPFLNMAVDVGDGAGFGTCDGFVPSARLYTGDLADFSRRHPAKDGLEVYRPVERDEVRTLRVQVSLERASGIDENEAQADFLWVVEPATSSTPPPPTRPSRP